MSRCRCREAKKFSHAQLCLLVLHFKQGLTEKQLRKFYKQIRSGICRKGRDAVFTVLKKVCVIVFDTSTAFAVGTDTKVIVFAFLRNRIIIFTKNVPKMPSSHCAKIVNIKKYCRHFFFPISTCRTAWKRVA